MTIFIKNPKTGMLETAKDPESMATPESVREYRRQLREQLNPSGEGWHEDEFSEKQKDKPTI